MIMRLAAITLAGGGLFAAGCGSTATDRNGSGDQPGGAAAGGTSSGGVASKAGAAAGGTSSGGVASEAGATAGGSVPSNSGAGQPGMGGVGVSSGGGGGGAIDGGGRSSAGDQAGGAAGSADADAAGGSAGASAFPPRPVCGGTISSGNERWCTGIENVTLSKGPLTDASGDGFVSPGEDVSIDIIMHNDGASAYNDPCVGLLADNPAVTIVGGEAHDNPAWNFFSIAAGQSLTVAMRFRVDASIPRGTTIRFLAWYAVLKANCANGSEVEFDVKVE